MKFETFLTDHWNKFVRHLSQYHPLEYDFIEKYQYELHWHSLSRNKKLDWQIDFLRQYEDRWAWHELSRNPSITWTEEWIETFKKRVKWDMLQWNTNLPVSEDFVEKYKKKIRIVDNNVHLTRALRRKYKDKLLQAIPDATQKMTPEQLDNLEETLQPVNFRKILSSQEILYDQYIKPQIDERGLRRIFEDKFDYSQRYFFLKPVQQDLHGLTPEFKIKEKNPFGTFREGRGFFEIPEPLTLVNGSLQEGPDRLYEVPRFADMSFYPVLIVSENVKEVLSTLKLPEHRFHTVKLKPKKLKTNTRYFIFQLPYDLITKNLNFGGVRLISQPRKIVGAKVIEKKTPIEAPIRNYEELNQWIEARNEELREEGKKIQVFPDQYKLVSTLDVYSDGRDIIVTAHVKRKLEQVFPGQMSFKSAQLLNIRMDQETYDKRKTELEGHTPEVEQVEVEESAEDQFFYQKKARLEETDSKPPEEMHRNDEFAQKEKELGVCFPAGFKEVYRDNKADEDYDFFPIAQFQVENEWSSRHPETYKSVIVAGNGCGDYLGLILEKESDYQLRNELYEYWHETGEITRYSILPPPSGEDSAPGDDPEPGLWSRLRKRWLD